MPTSFQAPMPISTTEAIVKKNDYNLKTMTKNSLLAEVIRFQMNICLELRLSVNISHSIVSLQVRI